MLKRTAQIGIKVEASEGVEETLVAADYSGNRKDTSSGVEVNTYARGIEKASLTELAELKGQRTGKVSITDEVVGGGAATAAPFHTTLRALGFTPTQVKSVAAGAPSGGTFRCGQVVGNHATQGSATKTGIFIKYTNSKIYYVPTVGTFANAETMYNYASPQVSSLLGGTPANAGFRFKPISETDSVLPDSVTVERRVGGQRHTRIGARGTGGISIKLGEPLLIRAEFQGCPVFDTNGKTPRAGAVVTSVPAVGASPKVAKGTALVLRQGATDYRPVMTALDIAINNTLAPRPTINDDDTAGSGYKPTRISGREITASIDPEHVLPAAFDFDGFAVSDDVFEIYHELGLPADTNGMFITHGPAVQITQHAEGERDGVITRPVPVKFTGFDDDEIVFYHLKD